jgi:eukaryotic-like serine/threonine-protein kinase
MILRDGVAGTEQRVNGGHTPRMGEADRAVARDLSLQGVRPPAKIPGYEHEQFLGHGAYGEVWIAVNRNSGRKVAIKFFTRRGGLDWAALAREVEKLRYLFSDRYVVQLFEVGWESEPPYYVMEYMENGSLEDLLRTGPLPVPDAVMYFREIAVALVHAHDKGILHCDLKPGNVLLDTDRRPRLADFGQSRLTNELSPALGTLFYMAPEQADLSAIPDARWDVYALGAVMYRMLTGAPPHYQREPFSEGNLESQLAAYRKHILDAPKPKAHRKVLGVDAELASIVDRCLETSVSKRYQNPQAVLTALDAWQLRRTRRPLLLLTGLGFGLIFLVMALIGAYVFWTSVNTAEREVIHRALDGNRFAARTEARQFGLQIQFRWAQLEAGARDQDLRRLLAMGDKLKEDPKACAELDELLGVRRARADRQFDEANRSSLWFAGDANGFQRGSDPPFDKQRHLYRGYRDYFHGLGHELPDRTGPAKTIIDSPHRSMVYRRAGSGDWSVAFTVPVWDDPDDEFLAEQVGILGMAIDLKGRTRVAGDRERFAVLIDTRTDATGRRGLIVRHPYLDESADGSEPRLVYTEEVVRWADAAGTFHAEEYYDDPVGGQYAGPWLASVERVVVRPEDGSPIDTGWVILVQERRDEVMHPVRQLQWRLGYGAFGATLFILLLLASITVGMISVLDGAPKSRVTRLLRRWAGLPTGGVTSTSSSTATGGSLGAKTARAAQTPDQESGVGSQEPEVGPDSTRPTPDS